MCESNFFPSFLMYNNLSKLSNKSNIAWYLSYRLGMSMFKQFKIQIPTTKLTSTGSFDSL